ncbi:MAG: hypothetical protein L3J50_11295 [Emcibacter sp.]|nr:hypothetical protein [Emcibacter sp.]
MKIVFRYDAGPELIHVLNKLEARGIYVVCCPEGCEEPFTTQLKDADALWHVLEPITAGTIAGAPNLKLIQKIGVGVNTIDLEAAKAYDVAVCNMPGTNSRAVAEMTLLLMLAVLRKLPMMDSICTTGGWAVDKNITETFGEIYGRTIGLVGFGEVPKFLAPVLELMGAKIIYTATNRKDVPYEFMSLDNVVQQSDIVSLHIPLNKKTHKILNAQRISRMKKNAILINTARGDLVDEKALYNALKSGALCGAGLDVFSQEPVNIDNILLTLDTVVKAPHVAWLTNETFERSIEIAVHNSVAAMGKKNFKYRVV